MPRKTHPRPLRRRRPGGFNEAAARCHGKRRHRPLPLDVPVRFNEAAARCHGKQARALDAAGRASVLQ